MLPKNIKLLYLYDFFISLRFYGAIQVIYFAHITRSYTLALSLFSMTTLSQALMEIPTGMYSDMIGRKNTIVISAFAAVVAVSFYAIGQSYLYLFMGALIEGFSRALGSGNNQALMYDSLKEMGKHEDYHKYYSKSGLLAQMAYGIAALVGGFLASVSFALALWLSVVTQIIAWLISLLLSHPPVFKKAVNTPYAHLQEAIKAFKDNPKLRLLTLANAIGDSLGEASYQFSVTFINMVWPLWAVSAMRTFTSFASAISFYSSDKIINRFKALPALTGQFLINRVINISAYLFPTLLSPILLAATSFTYGTSEVATNTLLQNEFTDHQRATMGSLNSLVSSVAFAIVSLLMGYFADRIGVRNILLITQILLLPVLFIYWRLFIHHRKTTK